MGEISAVIERRKMIGTVPGIIAYDPVRGADRGGRPILDLGRCSIRIPSGHGLVDFYAYQFRKKFGITLLKPDWDVHVTVIAKNRFNKKVKPWGYMDRKHVEVGYSNQMFWNHEHVWVAAECPELMEIREHYGNLSYDRGHMTIGRFHPNDIGRLPQFKKPEDIELWDKYIWNTPV